MSWPFYDPETPPPLFHWVIRPGYDDANDVALFCELHDDGSLGTDWVTKERARLSSWSAARHHFHWGTVDQARADRKKIEEQHRASWRRRYATGEPGAQQS